MKPKRFGIDNSYEESEYNSSLEAPFSRVKTLQDDQAVHKLAFSPFRYNKPALVFTSIVLGFIILIVLGVLIFGNSSTNKVNNSSENAQKIANYGVTKIPLDQLNNTQQLDVGSANLSINGQLQVNKTLILTPQSNPTDKITGQIYYDKVTNQPYYFNGTQSISLGASNQGPHVSSIAGATGNISLGNGLSINSNNQLSISSAILQSSTPANVNLTAGNGISIHGGTVDNTGVVSIIAGTNNLGISHDSSGNYVITSSGSGSTTAGGDLTGSYPNPTIAKLQGTTITLSSLSSGQVLQYNGSALVNSLITNANLSSGAFGNITGVGALSSGSIGGLFGNVAIGNNTFSGGNLTLGNAGLFTGAITLYSTANNNSTMLKSLAPNGSSQTITIPATNHVGGTDTVCLYNLQNCVGAGGGVTTSGGSQNFIPKYTNFSANQLGNSSISDDGSNVSVTGEGFVADSVTTPMLQSAGALAITAAGTLTLGTSNQRFIVQGSVASTITVGSGLNTTTLGFAALSGNQTITFPSASGVVCLQNSVSCGFAPAGTGVTKLNGLTGDLTVANATAAGVTITINNALADGVTKGIAAFNGTNFTSTLGVINTIQGISTAATPQFAGLILTGNLSLSATSSIFANNLVQTANGQLLSINAGNDQIKFYANGQSFEFPSTGGAGQTICTTGISCAAGGGQAVILGPNTAGVATVQTNNSPTLPSIFINNTGGANLLELQGNGTDKFTVAQDGTTSISGVANLNGGAIVTGILGVNTITPTSTLTIGDTSQQFIVQGNSNSVITATGGGFLTSVGFNIGSGGTAPTGNIIYRFENDNTVAPGTYDVCTTAGNCGGGGSGITGGGSSGHLAKFSAGTNIVDSIITDNGTSASVLGNLAVGTSGASQLSIGVGSSADGSLVIKNATNNNAITISEAAAPSGAVSLLLPTQSGTFAVSATGPITLNATTGQLSCATCLTSGGGGSGGVVSITGTDGGSTAINGALTLNNAGTSLGTITIDNALADGSTKGIASFNGTNFTSTLGVINTVQDIATGSSPTFSNLTLQGATGLTLGSVATGNAGQIVFNDGVHAFTNTFTQSTLSASRLITIPNTSGTLAVAVTGSNLTLSATGVLQVSDNPSFSGTLGVTGITTLTGQLNANGGIVTNNTNINAGTGTLTSGAINGQTIDTASFFTGNVTIQGATPLTLGTTGIATGSIGFKGSTGGSGLLTLTAPNSPTANTLTLPNETGTLCSTGSVCTGYAAASPSGNFVQLQSSTPGTQQSGSLNINGTAIAGILNITNGATIGNGLTVTAGDVAITGGNLSTNGTQRLSNGGALSNITGYTQSSGNFDQSASGGTFKTGSGNVSLNGATSVTGTNTLTVGTGATLLGGTLSVTSAPTNSATASLVQLGSAIVGGNSVANGGTYIGLNEPNSGAGSAADFLNFQNNGIAKLEVTSAGVLSVGSIGGTFGNINIGSNSFTGNGANISSLNGSNISSGTVNNSYLTNSGALIVGTAGGSGLSGGGSVALGGTLGLSVSYGSSLGTSVQGNTQLVCPSGSGNISGVGNTITLGSGGTCTAIGITQSPIFTGTITDNNSSGTALAITGTPQAAVGTSLIQGGSALSNAASNANGTYLGINNLTGVGSDFINLQYANATKFLVDNLGDIQVAGTETLGGNLTFTGPNATVSSNGTGSLKIIGTNTTSTGLTLSAAAGTTAAGGGISETAGTGGVSGTSGQTGGTVSISGGSGGTSSGGSANANGGAVSIQGGTAGSGGAGLAGSTGAINLQTAAGGNVTIGATTGNNGTTLTLGQATVGGETINIGNGNLASGTETINIGAPASSSGIVALMIGSLTGASSTTIQGGSGNINLSTSSNIVLGSGGNTITFSPTTSGATSPITCSGLGCQKKKIILTPEYAGAVLDTGSQANDVGTMTAGFDSTRRESYYQWSTAQGSNQSYDVVVQIPLPSDFNGWTSSTPISIDSKTSDTTNGTVLAALWDTSGTIESNWTYSGSVPGCSITPGSTSWATQTGCTVGGTYAANGVVTLRIRLQSPTSGTNLLGNIVLNYNSNL